MHLRTYSGKDYVFWECPNCSSVVQALIEQSNLPVKANKPFSALEVTPNNQTLLSDMKAVFNKRDLLTKGSWFLYGKTGCGKTFHASVFGHQLIRMHGLAVRFIQVSEHLNNLKRLFRLRNHDEYETEDPGGLLLRIKEAKVLIMDDINRRYTEFEIETLYDIIDYRYRNKLFTVFTAQTKDLEMLPEQTVSRISDMAFPYYLGGTNRRRTF